MRFRRGVGGVASIEIETKLNAMEHPARLKLSDSKLDEQFIGENYLRFVEDGRKGLRFD